jgi:hypothetical protein
MSRKYVIACDFDGVIHGYSKGYHDGTLYDPPVKFTKYALSRLMKAGNEIVIWSCRTYDHVLNGNLRPGQKAEMVRYLAEHEIPYTRFAEEGEGKPIADIYIDDNAYRFERNWAHNLNKIERILNK